MLTQKRRNLCCKLATGGSLVVKSTHINDGWIQQGCRQRFAGDKYLLLSCSAHLHICGYQIVAQGRFLGHQAESVATAAAAAGFPRAAPPLIPRPPAAHPFAPGQGEVLLSGCRSHNVVVPKNSGIPRCTYRHSGCSHFLHHLHL